MTLWTAQCFAYVLAMVVCVLLKSSQSQDCSTEKMENITIDIKAAFSKGIRGTDPIFTASSEACVNVCCMRGKAEGSKLCNYAIFNTQKKGKNPNCYLFYYPTKEVFPSKRVLGLVTYRIKKISKPVSSTATFFHPTVNGSFKSTQVSMLDPHSTASPSHEPAPLQKPIVSNGMEILHNSDRTGGYSHHPKEEVVNDSKSTPPHKTGSLLLTSIVNPVRHTVPTVDPLVQLPVFTTGTQTGTVGAVHSHASPSHTTTTRSATASHRNTLLEAVTPKSTSTLHSSAASGSSASKTTQSPLGLPANGSSTSLHHVPLSNEQQDFESDKVDGGPAKKLTFLSGDQSILLIALLTGVIFLLLVTILVGGKMLESLKQRQYTRLDYLINGMYSHM